MEGENAVDDGIDGLAVVEGVGDQAEVAGGGGGVEAKVGDCIAVRHRRTEREKKEGTDSRG